MPRRLGGSANDALANDAVFAESVRVLPVDGVRVSTVRSSGLTILTASFIRKERRESRVAG